MAGPLDQSTDEGVGATLPNMEGPVERTGFFANVAAGYKAAQAGPGSTRSRQNAHEAKIYDEVINALTAEGEMGADKIEVRPNSWGYTGPKNIPVNQYGVGLIPKPRPFRNPYTGKPSISQADNPLARLYLEGDAEERGAIWTAVERVRQRKPDFLKSIPDEQALAALAEKSRNALRAEAEAVMSRAGKTGAVGGFVGAVAGSIVAGDPENFVGVGVGVAAGKVTARAVVKRAVTEGAVNASAGVIALPGQADDLERLGDGPMTGKETVRSIAEQAAIGAVFGTAGALAPAGARKAGQAAEAIGGKVVDVAGSVPAVRDALAAASLRAGTVKDRELLTEYRRLHSPYAVSDTSTPDERAAISVVERDVEVRETSPLPPDADTNNEGRLDAIAASLGVQIKPPPLPSSAPVQAPTVSEPGGQRRATSYDEGLHRAEGTGKNPDSSATGHFQFIESTWLEYAPRVADTSGMSRAQILALRQDRSIATKAEHLFRADNGRYLRARGIEDSAGNLSLAHFLGKADAAKVLLADPNTPISELVDAASLRANRSVFSKNATAGKLVQWAHKRIGATVGQPPARPDAVPQATDEIDYMSVRPYETVQLTPDEVETDAGLMQYKSGGDQAGVTDKLKDVIAWNPIISSEILVWESANGRRVVVDGHQRTGLAKRLYPEDDSIRIPAIVIREVDGVTAAQARVLGALRNINLGTGSLLDNARVLRDAPGGAAMLRGAEGRREIEGLAALNHEAFGAALNNVIDPEIAAAIGNIARDEPDTHMSLVELMLKSKVRNPREAALIVRQARADGYGRPEAEQLGMFGDAPTESLYVPIARILDAAEKRLRDEKRTFKTLATKAGRIEGAGNKLDRQANEGKVVSSDEALAILSATAHRSGPVRDVLIAAARAELSGARRGDAVSGFLDALAGIDLRAAARGVERDGRTGEPSGEAGSGDAVSSSAGELPDSLEPSLFEQALDSAERSQAFSDPVGQGARDQVALLEHDLRMDADPAIADRQAQETQLRTDSPLRPGDIDAEGTMGLGLFDAADQPTFRLDDQGDARPIADLLAETKADELAAAHARDCLL